MLRVTVELVPWGVLPARRLAEIEIANDGMGSTDVGDYDYRIMTLGGLGHPHRGGWYKLHGHRRRDGALRLFAAILVQHRLGPREGSAGPSHRQGRGAGRASAAYPPGEPSPWDRSPAASRPPEQPGTLVMTRAGRAEGQDGDRPPSDGAHLDALR